MTDDPVKALRAALNVRSRALRDTLRAVSTELSATPASAETGDPFRRFLEIKTERERLRIEIEKARLAIIQNQYVDKEAVIQLIGDLAQQIRDAWLVWPMMVAPKIAEKFGLSVSEVQAVLDEEIREYLTRLGEPEFYQSAARQRLAQKGERAARKSRRSKK